MWAMGGDGGPRGDGLGVALTHQGRVAHLAVAGELDLAAVPRFESLIAAAFEMADHCLSTWRS